MTRPKTARARAQRRKGLRSASRASPFRRSRALRLRVRAFPTTPAIVLILGFVFTVNAEAARVAAFEPPTALNPRPAQHESSTPNSNTAEAHLGKGYEAEKDDRYEEAAEEFKAALAVNSRLIRARYQLAVCLFALGDLPAAREEFERLARETRRDAGVVYYEARLDLRAGDAAAAAQKLASLADHPPFPDTAFYLGEAYLEEGEFDKAEKWLKAAARSDPRDYRVPDHLARVYLRKGRKAEAESQFRLSAELRERYNQASRQAVACSHALESGPFAKAQPDCQRLFDLRDPDKLTTLGLLYGRHGHYAEAVPALEKAAQLDPDSYEIQHDLGLTYFRLKWYDKARTALERSAALRPDFFGSNALLGATLYALREDETAYKILNRAHSLNPEDGDTANLLFQESLILADREEAHQHYELARTYLEKARRLRPDDGGVLQRLSRVSRHLDNPQTKSPR